MIIEALKAFLFGVVEGITEWLPISSTGHMMLLNEFVTLDVSAAFYDTFLVVIQLGAILAVILLYFNKLNPFSQRKTQAQRNETWGIWAKVVVGSIPAAIVGFALDDWMEEHLMNGAYGYVVVAAALIVYGIIFIVMENRNARLIGIAKARKDYQNSAAAQKVRAARGVAPEAALAAGEGTGTEAVFGEEGTLASNAGEDTASNLDARRASARARLDARRSTNNARANDGRVGSRRDGATAAAEGESYLGSDEQDESSAIAKVTTFSELSYARAFAIGIFESLAIIPGTSRSGSTIIGSMLLGTSRTIATEFAFFLAIPIMFGWSLLKFIKHGFAYTGTEWMIFAIGIVVSFVVSVLSIKFLIGYIKKNDFKPFGIYRIVLGVIILAFFAIRSFVL
jgi:undecaprenyl-diphosphatase